MRYSLAPIFLIISLSLIFQAASGQVLCPVIPLPAQAERQSGFFSLNESTPISISDDALRPVAHYIQKELLRKNSLSLSIQSKTKMPAIRLVLLKKRKDEAYTLQMNTRGISISAANPEGVFYGAVSVLQMISQSPVKNGNMALSCWNINDKPAYSWRGIMLDESRHFFGKEKVKSILDWMAFYKLNRFHWHLTDEPGWRLEVRKYPKLALIGGIGNYLNENAPASYYTQEDIKEIVAYAAERYIIVVPEIDMPGHATAANKAYPQFSGGGSAGHPEFTFNPALPATYTYLSDILREVNVLFPSGMIHLGGDEVSYGNEKWNTNQDLKEMMKEEGLADVKGVERYFMKRMADSVYGLNAKVLVWDEAADAGLPPEKTVMFWWRHDKEDQLKLALAKGYKTVLCPRLPFYFDFVQDSTHTYGRKWGKQYNALKDVYEFLPERYAKHFKEKDQILGIQANLWTETVYNEQRLDFLLFPRIAALAEGAWTLAPVKNHEEFIERLRGHIRLYKEAGIYCYDPFQPSKNSEPGRREVGLKRFETEE